MHQLYMQVYSIILCQHKDLKMIFQSHYSKIIIQQHIFLTVIIYSPVKSDH